MQRLTVASVKLLWETYKGIGLKVALAVGAGLVVAGQFVPQVGNWIADNKFLGAGYLLLLAFLLLDVVLTGRRPQIEQSQYPASLEYTGQISGLFPQLRQSKSIKLQLASYSSETFYAALTPLLAEIANGSTAARSVSLHLLVPDCSAPMGVPCLADSHRELPAYKRILVQRTTRFIDEFENAFRRILASQPHVRLEFEVRQHHLSPVFKLAIIQDNLAYHGFYPVDRTPVDIGAKKQIFLDYRGERTVLVRSELRGPSGEEVMYNSLQSWYESIWDIAQSVRMVESKGT